jgi:acyl-CoA thioester hydrolase
LADLSLKKVEQLRSADQSFATNTGDPGDRLAPQSDAMAFETGIFQWPVRVYWEDTDAGGIVFYANYLKFFERSRTEWLRSLGLEQQRLKDDTGAMFVVTEAQIRYHRPARLDDELVVTARTLKAGRAAMLIHQQALLQPAQASDQAALLCEGTIRIGWVQAATMQPARIPALILDRLRNR